MDFRKHVFGLAVTTALLSVAWPAQAQITSGPIDLQLFRPASDSKGYFTLNGAQILAPLDFSFGLVSTIAWKPLELRGTVSPYGQSPSTNVDSAVTIKNIITTTLQGAVGIVQGDHVGLQIGLVLPIVVLSG